MVCNGKTNRPRFEGLLVPLLKMIEKLNKISIKNWQIFVVEVCTKKSDNMSFWWNVLESKATDFVIRVRVKEIKIFFLLTWVTRAIGFRYNCVK